jgi:hypothetical protein
VNLLSEDRGVSWQIPVSRALPRAGRWARLPWGWLQEEEEEELFCGFFKSDS